MHLIKDYEDYIMYGYAAKAGKNKNPEKLLTNAFYKSNAFNKSSLLSCNCKTLDYTDYIQTDIGKTKEVAVRMNTISKIVDPREINTTRDIYVVINGKAYVPETIEARLSFREYMEFYLSVSTDPRYAVENTILAIKDVIFNPPATIVFWGDDSKTVVKCQDGEEFDPEKGLTMAFFKKMHGNTGHYFEEIKKWRHKYAMSLFTDEVHTMDYEEVMKAIEAGISGSID